MFTGKWNPVDPRDPAELVALLRKSLPSIPPRDSLAIAAAHGLATIYQLDPSIIPEPAAPDPPAGGVGNPALQVTGNPWLFIVIGLLLVTGILLYVDPRIF